MSYATAQFYKNNYCGDSIPDDKLEGILKRASFDIDTLTRRKIHKFGGFEKLSDFEKLCVQLAVCSQADYIHTKGFVQGFSSYSVGDVSVSLDNTSGDYDKGCLAYLNSTRLMYRGL